MLGQEAHLGRGKKDKNLARAEGKGPWGGGRAKPRDRNPEENGEWLTRVQVEDAVGQGVPMRPSSGTSWDLVVACGGQGAGVQRGSEGQAGPPMLGRGAEEKGGP